MEIHSDGVQPRHFHPGCQRCAVCHRGITGFPPQYLWEGEYVFADWGGVLRNAVLHTPGPLDLDRAHRGFARHFFLYHYLGVALRSFSPATAAVANARA